MDGGETTRLLNSGEVPVFPNIHSMRDGSVNFSDDQHTKPDLIIYATGYRPSLDYVSDIALDENSGDPIIQDMRSVNVPGIYFVGFDNTVNFRSRYLRGIRNDTKILATTIQQALTSS
ncbi:MAG TPA: hypothetical protein ENI62_00315 [Gammaproteobacteria bacterium]|nr:hypothetical protein [Gammaproteobacteria bacterium]